jgi:hypothetical protein
VSRRAQISLLKAKSFKGIKTFTSSSLPQMGYGQFLRIPSRCLSYCSDARYLAFSKKALHFSIARLSLVPTLHIFFFFKGRATASFPKFSAHFWLPILTVNLAVNHNHATG